jgi:hypothetical protein
MGLRIDLHCLNVSPSTTLIPHEPSFKRVNFDDPCCTSQFYVAFNEALYTMKRLFAGTVFTLLRPVPWTGLHAQRDSPAADILPQPTSLNLDGTSQLIRSRDIDGRMIKGRLKKLSRDMGWVPLVQN